MKRKVLFIALTVSIALLAFPVIASAAYTHGDFGGNSKGCGDCHITHAGDAMKLLISASGGGTQTDVCYSCHDNVSASPYNVADGIIKGNDGKTRPSFAGGFDVSPDFQDTNLTSSLIADGNVAAADSFFKGTTSVHSVELMADSSSTQGQPNKTIPGGTGTTGALGFRCGSCHDPHAGGAYDPTATPYKNPRLLRLNGLPASGSVDRAVYMTIDFTAGTGTLLPSAYGYAADDQPSGFDKWCGGCHDVFDTDYTHADANGHTNGSGSTKYRHLVGVDLTAVGNTKQLPSLNVLQEKGYDLAGIPLDEAGSNGRILTCISCHRAHGTSSTVDASVSYKRYENYNGDGTSFDSTVLLRMKDRDVCWRCHGAGQYNFSWH